MLGERRFVHFEEDPLVSLRIPPDRHPGWDRARVLVGFKALPHREGGTDLDVAPRPQEFVSGRIAVRRSGTDAFRTALLSERLAPRQQPGPDASTLLLRVNPNVEVEWPALVGVLPSRLPVGDDRVTVQHDPRVAFEVGRRQVP